MGDRIKVNTARLKSDMDSIGGYIQKIDSEIAKLRNDTGKLDAMWDGPSSKKFKEAFNSDIESLTVIVRNLRKIHNYENTARASYDNCEQKVAELIGGIRV